MTTDTYTGTFDGNWFDPSNWSAGEPVPGDSVDIFGATGADATAGTVAGMTIDLSATFLPQTPGDLTPPVYNIVANTLGTQAAPVAIVVTADSGRTASAGISVDVVDGSVTVDANGETIVRERRDAVVFWHIELEHHAILLAEGAPAESYLDTGNRAQFGNCPLLYEASDAARQEPCAEMVFAGSRLEKIRDRLGRLPVAPPTRAALEGIAAP